MSLHDRQQDAKPKAPLLSDAKRCQAVANIAKRFISIGASYQEAMAKAFVAEEIAYCNERDKHLEELWERSK